MKLTQFLFIVFFIGLATDNAYAQIDLGKIWKSYAYLPETVPGFKFMNDGQHYTKQNENRIVKYDLLTGNKTDVILNASKLKGTQGFNGQFSSYSFSNDEKFIILESMRESIYRRSSKAYFYVYNRDTEELTAIREGSKVSYASLSPDNKKLAYVFENNIYIQDLEDAETISVTTDGIQNKIINGSADWVYEEEFSMSKAFSWNSDGSQLAYQRFDETDVTEFTMTNYKNELYPEYVRFKYPKVGEKNAIVSAHVYRIKDGHTIDLDLQEESDDIYIPRIKWTQHNDRVFVYTLNRHQNLLRVHDFNTGNGEHAIIIEEKNKYYIDITDDIQFLDQQDAFIWSSEKSGYNHLYLYNLDGQQISMLTQGNYDVTQFYGVDESRGTVYYQSAERSPLERQVYAVDLNGENKRIMTPDSGTNSLQFSSTFDYFVNTHSTINTPPTYNVSDIEGNIIRELEDNKALARRQEKEGVQNVEFFEFDNSAGVSLNGYMIKPADMEDGKEYPLFMYVYGGPGSQNVTNAWKGQNYWWFQMLAQNGYVVACVDNRGTGARGEEFKKMTYLQLGHYETIDQTDAARHLGALDFIDSKRIGIFGWSYGGYMSSLCILKSNDVFRAAIAVAPVTNWKWYDTIYTERYMRTVKENKEGYDQNSPVNFADRLKGSYLLIHGMGDDNVHFQHTAEMANALVNADKQFETYFYPNKNHSIFGGPTRHHLYTKMTNFIMNNL